MFRIGEFSKIARVSGRLLRYYDEIGLLQPEHTDPLTGYRYYSAHQLSRLNRILVLKELGLSLDHIARLLDHATSPDEIRGMLILRKAQIEQSLKDEMARLREVETRLQQIDVLQEESVILKSVGAQPFLAVRAVLSDMAAIQHRVQRIANIIPTRVAPTSLDQIALVLHSPMYDPDAFDVEIGYILSGPAPELVNVDDEYRLTLRELPAVETLATAVHVGRVRDSHHTYGALGLWLEHNGWQVGAVGREILIHLPQPRPDDTAVMEIQVAVTRRA